MKTINTKYNFWLAGYYEDFASCRAVPDDLNLANYRVLDHTLSHFGSAIGGNAKLNPRFKFSFPDRVRDAQGYFLNEPLITDRYASTNENKLSHNSSIADWLTRDLTLEDNGKYNSKSWLQYPISIAGNRQAFGGLVGANGTGDSYIAFRNGHSTEGVYYCPLGSMDFSYGASHISKYGQADRYTATDRSVLAGNPIGYYHKGTTRTAGNTDWDTPDKSMSMVSFASVYTGEIPKLAFTSTKPDALIKPITSPSKMPFLIHNLFVERGDGLTPSTTSATERLITYDGDLNFKGIGESFHIRLMFHKISQFNVHEFTLKVGYKNTATYNKSTNNFDDTTSLIVLEFTLADIGLSGNLTEYQQGFPTPQVVVDDWVDIEIVPDFSTLQWKAYANGNTTHFATAPISSAVTVNTAKGWSLDVTWEHDIDDYVCMTTLIDRVGVALPLTNKFDGDLNSIPSVSSFNITYGSNRVSSADIKILDDNDNYILAPLTTGVSASEWEMLLFYDGEDRPLWRGIIESVNYTQDTFNNTKEVNITARDGFTVLERTLPIWEVGQNAFFSLNDHISMSSSYEKKARETQAIATSMLLGSSFLTPKSNTLAFNKYDNEEYSQYSNSLNKRTNLFSSSAIQMYINEDPDGANEAEREWEGGGDNNADTFSLCDIAGIYNVAGYRYLFVKWEDKNSKPTGTITSFRGLTAGNQVTVKGTAYDGDYQIDSFIYLANKFAIDDPYKQTDGKVYYVGIKIIDASATLNEGATNIVDRAAELSNAGTKDYAPSKYDAIRLEMDAATTHSFEIGDTVQLTYDSNDGNDCYLFPFKVVAIPDNQTIYVEVPKNRTTTINASWFSGNIPQIQPYTDINGYSATTEPQTKAILFRTSSNLLTDTTMQRVKHRNVHARWIRDLAKSVWFKAQFGVIAKLPHWRAGKGSFLQKPFTTSQAALLSGWNADGTVSNWIGLNADITTAATTITFDEPAMWYLSKINKIEDPIVDLIDIETNEMQYIIGSGFSTPSVLTGLDWDNSNNRFETPSNHSFSLGDIVVHDGFVKEQLNGIHMVKSIPTSTTYETWKIDSFVATRGNSYAYLQARSQGNSSWSDGVSRHYEDPDGIEANFVSSDQFADSPFSYLTGVGKVYYGTTTLQNVKGLKRNWKQDHTIYNLRQIDESNGYKHCFALWADMRNDGTADADGGYRKNDFGLILPTNENYSVNLSFAEQVDANGNPDIFAELKIGEDLDIWSLNAEVEPYTEGAWSALNDASNSEPLDTRYHNWEDKGGAVCLIDVSRFWNLNTAACGGRSGYDSGGLVDFGDYEVATFGFPYLIDNYYKEACASYKTVDTTGISPSIATTHPNSIYFINDGTKTTADISIGNTRVYVQDNAEFDTSGYGVILCEGGSNRDTEKTAYYIYWNGKGSINLAGTPRDYLDNVYIAFYSVVATPKEAVNLLKADSSSYSSGSTVSIKSNEFKTQEQQTEDGFDKVTIYNTTAALFGLRLILNLQGIITTQHNGTFFAHDKIRYLQNMMIADTWATNARLPFISDINNVPITINNSGDDYGSTIDARTQTFLSIMTQMADKEGNGLGGDIKNFSWLIGRDNRMEFRPSYASHKTLNRNNLKISNMNTATGSKITNVRVYYNGNSSFVDYPEPSTADVRFRVVNHPQLFSKTEALAIAKQEYYKENTSRISINAEVIRESDGTNIMVGNGRYGYVADTFRKGYYNNPQSLSWWGNVVGGHLFCGMQNALDVVGVAKEHSAGQNYAILDFEDFPATTNVIPVLLHRDGASVVNPTTTSGSITTIIPANTAQFDFHGGSGTPVVLSSAGWYELDCIVSGTTYTLTVYYNGNGLDTDTSDLYFGEGVNRVPFTDPSVFSQYSSAYYFYGANSLSHAIQVVHIDDGTNKESSSTGNELRLAIECSSGTDSTDAVFTLYLIDPVFNESIVSSTPPEFSVNSANYTTTTLNSNGFVEATVPSSYDADEPKITFSVNLEYLRELVRLRCNNAAANGHSTICNGNITLLGSTDTNSIFPLGMREYSEMGGIADERTTYYAPRLHIVTDTSYIPATTLTYNDNYIDMSNETMVLKSVQWSQNEREHESVRLNLEKIEAHFPYSFASVFKNNASSTGQPSRQEPPPPTPKPYGNTGNGSLGGSVSAVPNQYMTGTGTGDPAAETMFAGMGMNQLSNSMIRAIRGKANFRADNASSGGQWGVLGSQNTGIASSFDRAIDSAEGNFTSSEGSAIATSDGFSLAGINDAEVGVQGEVHSHTINIRVPNDTSTAYVSVEANLTLESISGGGDAEITTTVSCKEEGTSISATKIIAQGTVRQTKMLLPATFLQGASTPNNTLEVKIERRPAQNNDTADYQTLVIHNLSVNLRRYNIPTVAQSRTYQPY